MPAEVMIRPANPPSPCTPSLPSSTASTAPSTKNRRDDRSRRRRRVVVRLLADKVAIERYGRIGGGPPRVARQQAGRVDGAREAVKSPDVRRQSVDEERRLQFPGLVEREHVELHGAGVLDVDAQAIRPHLAHAHGIEDITRGAVVALDEIENIATDHFRDGKILTWRSQIRIRYRGSRFNEGFPAPVRHRPIANAAQRRDGGKAGEEIGRSAAEAETTGERGADFRGLAAPAHAGRRNPFGRGRPLEQRGRSAARATGWLGRDSARRLSTS